MKKINIKNNTNELFSDSIIQENNERNTKRFFTKLGVFFIACLFASIITIFADSNPDANDPENDNIRECQIEITKCSGELSEKILQVKKGGKYKTTGMACGSTSSCKTTEQHNCTNLLEKSHKLTYYPEEIELNEAGTHTITATCDCDCDEKFFEVEVIELKITACDFNSSNGNITISYSSSVAMTDVKITGFNSLSEPIKLLDGSFSIDGKYKDKNFRSLNSFNLIKQEMSSVSESGVFFSCYILEDGIGLVTFPPDATFNHLVYVKYILRFEKEIKNIIRLYDSRLIQSLKPGENSFLYSGDCSIDTNVEKIKEITTYGSFSYLKNNDTLFRTTTRRDGNYLLGKNRKVETSVAGLEFFIESKNDDKIEFNITFTMRGPSGSFGFGKTSAKLELN